jgi:type VI secretion system protein ImpK
MKASALRSRRIGRCRIRLHRLKREVPVWAIGAVFALVALLGYLGLNTYLKDKTLQALAPYSQVIKVGPSRRMTISLP